MDYAYLLQHPTAMPVAEAAMTNIFAYSQPVLRLIVTPAEVAEQHERQQDESLQDELLAACGG
jgi:hypothetical protein